MRDALGPPAHHVPLALGMGVKHGYAVLQREATDDADA